MVTITNKYYFLSLLNSRNEHIHFSEGVFKLKHGTEYKVMIRNDHRSCRANAKINIDGKLIGRFRIEANSKIVIERPDDDNKARKLTFYNINSEEGRAGNLTNIPSSDLGKIKIEIQKEIERSLSTDEDDYLDCSSPPRRGMCVQTDGGGTALGRKSKQKFYIASPIETVPEIYILEARMILQDDDPPIVPL
jgi:hypothetical protein